jgi:hypothetical protein
VRRDATGDDDNGLGSANELRFTPADAGIEHNINKNSAVIIFMPQLVDFVFPEVDGQTARIPPRRCAMAPCLGYSQEGYHAKLSLFRPSLHLNSTRSTFAFGRRLMSRHKFKRALEFFPA